MGFPKTFSVIGSIYHFLTYIFKKGDTENRNESQDRFSTPPRAPSRAGRKEFEVGNARDRRPYNDNTRCLPSRLPKNFPLTRKPSEIALLGTGTPFRPADIRRARGSATNLHGTANEVFDFDYPGISAMNVRREGRVRDFQDERSNSSTGYHSASEDQWHAPLNDASDFEECITTRNSRLNNNPYSVAGIPASMHSYNMTNAGEPLRRICSVPHSLPSRVPEAYPLTRTLSQVSLLGSSLNKYTPFRTKGMRRTRGSNTNLRNSKNNASDLNFQELSTTNTKKQDVSQDLCHVSTHKGSKQSFDYYSAAGDQVSMQLNDASECREALNNRQMQLRNNPHPMPGYSFPCRSKIPIRNYSPKSPKFRQLSQRQRFRHTLTGTKRNSYGIPGFQENENITGIESSDISNWIAFRSDTSMKFERVFKSVSKKKHHSTGNIIDASSHAQWLKLAGITFDKDAYTFKNFAGGKVVLTFGEYKFLIHKICTAHDLDYWDVLRKMATFQEELHHDEGAVFL